MHLVEEHYCTVHKTILKILGIWPHDKSRLVFLQRMLFMTLAVIYVILQLTVFITSKYNVALFVKIMSFAFPSIIITIKYCFFIFKSKTIEFLHDCIQEDWKLLRNKLENDIMENNVYECRNYIILIFRASKLLVVFIIMIGFFPVILDFVTPLDESRKFRLLFEVEYFISQKKYFYFITFHATITFLLYTSILLATGSQLLTFLYHSFGLFKIASHRINHFIHDDVMHMPNCEKERAVCKRIIHIVNAHRRAIEFSNIILSSALNVLYCTIAIIGVFSLSVNLFRFIQAITVSKNMEDILVSFLAICGHLIYMFLTILVAQMAIDYNNKIFKLVYGIPWYCLPVTSQKLILLLLTTTGKEFCYTIGYIFVGKLENFATLVNTAVSYVTVMYSVQ